MQDRARPANMHSARGRRHTAEEKKTTTGIDVRQHNMQTQDTKQISAAHYGEMGGTKMDVLLDRNEKTEADEIIKFVKSLTTNERYEFVGIIRGVQMARRAESGKEQK